MVTELAFMGFLFFLLRNVMNAISVAQARRVAELAFHDIYKGGDQSDSESRAMLRTIQNQLGKAQHLFSQQGGGLGRYFTRSHEFSVYWLQEDKRSTEEFERLPRVKWVCVSQTELRSTD